MRVFYLPLESYRERYTELLTRWTLTRWAQDTTVRVLPVIGNHLPAAESIQVGTVLDAHGRSFYAATQIAALVRAMRDEGARSEDVIYLDDMFTPGYEAIPYILDQLLPSYRPRVFARNHAQSVDPDDFVFPMRRWMRLYERMVFETASGIICASTVHKEMMEAAMLDRCPTHVLGLPYDAADVINIAGAHTLWKDRPTKVIYASRFDREKQPHFFMDIVEESHAKHPGQIDFVVCTGGESLRSNDHTALKRAWDLIRDGSLRLRTSCSKKDYYAELGTARVQLNTARQDFISYTAIEASTLGTPTLAPAFRSFPEALRNRERVLYVPWSVDDAVTKLTRLLREGDDPEETAVLSRQQHGTLDRILAVMKAAS